MEKLENIRRVRRMSLKLALSACFICGILLNLNTASGTTSTTGSSLTAAILDQSGHAVEYAVVSLHTDTPSQADPSTVVVMDQRRLQFEPTVLAIQVGSNVSFPNEDDVRHHVYSFSHPNSFELKLYHGEGGQYQRFEHTGIVALGCNIHDGMLGFLRVVDTPYFATSDASGSLEIENVPPGNYTIQLWHPDLGTRIVQQHITMSAGPSNISLSLDLDEKAPAPAKPSQVHPLQSLFRD